MTNTVVLFIIDLLKRRRKVASQLAIDLGVSHTTVGRWLSGKEVPSIRSCQKLAQFSGVPVETILSLAGYLPKQVRERGPEWPEFREYARRKYPDELDEDLITMIEDLIERRRERARGKGNP